MIRVPFMLLVFTTLSLTLAADTVGVEDVVHEIDLAAYEVILAAPVLRSYPVAAALKRAEERGVPVYLLTEDRRLTDSKSFWGGLTFAGCTLYAVPRVTGYTLIIDGRTAISGPLLALPPSPSLPPTYRYTRPEEVYQHRRAVVSLMRSPHSSKISKETIVQLLYGGN